VPFCPPDRLTGCHSSILRAAHDMVEWSRLQYFASSLKVAPENWRTAHAASALTSKLRASLAAVVNSLGASGPITASTAASTISRSGFVGGSSSNPSRMSRTKYSSPSSLLSMFFSPWKYLLRSRPIFESTNPLKEAYAPLSTPGTMRTHDCQTDGAKLPAICTIAKSNIQNASASARLPNRMYKTPCHLHDCQIEYTKRLCICTIAKSNVQNSLPSARLPN